MLVSVWVAGAWIVLRMINWWWWMRTWLGVIGVVVRIIVVLVGGRRAAVVGTFLWGTVARWGAAGVTYAQNLIS